MRKQSVVLVALLLAASGAGVELWNPRPAAAAPVAASVVASAAAPAADTDGTLVVTVVDAQGKPVANATVTLSDADDPSRQRASATTDADGKATIHYRAGKYQFRAVGGGGGDSGLTGATLVAGKTANVKATVRARTR